MQSSLEIQAKQCVYLGGTIVNMLAFLWEIYKGFVYPSVFMINFWILEFLIAHREKELKNAKSSKARHSSWKCLTIDSSDYKGIHHYHTPMVPASALSASLWELTCLLPCPTLPSFLPFSPPSFLPLFSFIHSFINYLLLTLCQARCYLLRSTTVNKTGQIPALT